MSPTSQQKCEQCNRKPKLVDPVTGQVKPYCGKTCAATAKASSKYANNPVPVEPAGRRGASANFGNAPAPASASAASGQSTKLLRSVSEELSKAKKEAGDGIDNDVINRFKRKNLWQFTEAKGTADVTMTRNFNGESINISFSLNKIDDSSDTDSDSDDESDDGSDSENSYGSDNSEDGDDKDDKDEGLALECRVTISKPGKGTMLIKCDAIDGEFEVLGFSVTQDTNVAVVKSAEQDFTRKSLYVSPEFDDFGEHFQEQFVEYLAHRGIDSDLARFMQEYAKHKDQLEKVNLLERIQSFLS